MVVRRVDRFSGRVELPVGVIAVYGVKGVNRQAWSASWKLNCFESKKHSWMQSWFFCVVEGQRVINGDCWLFDVLRHLSYSVYGWVADICVRNSQELASPEKNAHLWQRYDSCCSWLQRPTSRSPVWCLLSFNMIVASNVEGSWKLTKDDVILQRERCFLRLADSKQVSLCPSSNRIERRAKTERIVIWCTGVGQGNTSQWSTGGQK